ncbi:MAG: hypothetical protein K9M84_00355 [Spirochaetia bacterium]|nr:hypothetical protein [Spirochaetia bacterium]
MPVPHAPIAWKNPDGSIAAVIHNPDSLPHQLNLWCASRRAPLDCPPESILSIRIHPQGRKIPIGMRRTGERA